MLYVSVGDVVPADDSVSAGSHTSALLPSELTQHLDVYDGSLGSVVLFVLCSPIGLFYTVLTADCNLVLFWPAVDICALNFAVLFGSRNLRNKGLANIKGFTVCYIVS